MKQYGIRLWLANALIVVALVVLVVFLIGQFAPSTAGTIDALLPVLAIVVSVCAILFAVFEGILLYREWAQAAKQNETTE